MLTARIRTTVYFGALMGALVLAFFIARPYATGILLALTFSMLAEGFHRRVLRWCGLREGLAALITSLLIAVIVVVPFVILGSRVLGEAGRVYSRLAESGTFTVNAPIEGGLITADMFARVGEYVRQGILWGLQNLGIVFSSIASIGVNAFVGVIALFYFLKDGERIRRKFIEWSPLGHVATEKILAKLSLAMHSVISGTLFIAVIQGVAAGIGFTVLGVPQPALWGAVTVLTALIPAVGSMLVTAPATVYLFFTVGPTRAILLFLWGAIVVGSIDNFLRPKLIERHTDIHPFLILISVFGGISLFGPLGFILGPLVLSLLFALFELYPEFAGE